MLLLNITQGDMEEELFVNFKEGTCTMIAASWNYGLHMPETSIVVQAANLVTASLKSKKNL